MNADKIRNLTDVELQHQERDLADQLFKLKFQMNMGQTESLKKIRGLRRDIARVKTVMREQELAAAGTKTKAKRDGEKIMADSNIPETRGQERQAEPQDSDRHGHVEQDAEDDRGRGDAQEGASAV